MKELTSFDGVAANLGRRVGDGDCVVEIPLARILFIPEAYPRAATNTDRIEKFRWKIRDGKPINPVMLIPIIDGTNSTHVLLDGRLRQIAYAEENREDIRAVVNLDFTVTKDDLLRDETLTEIKYLAAAINDNNGLSFSNSEIKCFVVDLYKRGIKEDKLCEFASRATISRWLSPYKNEQKDARKARVIALLDEGIAKKRIARETGVPRTTIIEWNSERKHNGDEGCQQGGVEKSRVRFFDTIPKEREQPPEEIIQEDLFSETSGTAIAVLRELMEKIRLLPWSRSLEAYVMGNLIPMLSNKSPNFSQVIKDGELAGLIHQLYLERDSLFKKLRDAVDKTESYKTKYEEIEEKQKIAFACSRDCVHAREREREWLLKALKANVENAVDNISLVGKFTKEAFHRLADKSLKVVHSTYEWGKMRGVLTGDDVKFIQLLEQAIEDFENRGTKQSESIGSGIKRIRRIRKLFTTEQGNDYKDS